MVVEEDVSETTEVDHPLPHRGEDAQDLCIVWLNSEGAVRVTALCGRDQVVVGRGETCDTLLPGHLVSRQHARIARAGASWCIYDLDSRNGVHVDGRAAAQAPLVEGTLLRLGCWIGILRARPEPDPHAYGALGDGLFGGPDLRSALNMLELAASSDLSIVLEGETGTGKELFARAVHRRSQRAGAFVAINCAVYQPATAVAELFGHKKGAFTGAVEAHPGLIRAAEGGTLLLDEITDLSLDVQAQLLRAIESGELIPLGESRAVRVDVRFVAATQQPLARAVADGRFRADLRARLEGLRVAIPPLRSRLGDVPLLFLHLLRLHAEHPPHPDAHVLEWLCLHDWPLNVREMVALVRRLLALHPRATTLSLEQLRSELPRALRSPSTDAPRTNPAKPVRRVDPRILNPHELAALRAALDRHSGSVAKAAAELAITRQRAYRMLKSLPG